MSRKINPEKSRAFANFDHYLKNLQRRFYNWEIYPLGEFHTGIDGRRRQKFAVQMVSEFVNCNNETVRTCTTMMETIFPATAITRFDGWLREWQAAQERKA